MGFCCNKTRMKASLVNAVLFWFCRNKTRMKLINVAVNAVLSLNVDFVELQDENDRFDKQDKYWQELLQSIAHVKNLELGPWCKPTDMLSRCYPNEDEQSRRFEAHKFKDHHKFVQPLVKYLLKNATLLKKFVLACKFKGSDASRVILSHASVVFAY